MPPLHPHILIDLEWKPESGGQVMCWQRLAEAARHAEGLRLTLHAQGAKEEAHDLNPHARLLLHAPVFSTRRLPFLGHVPAHTDMAHYHPKLAESLAGADVIHTTDAFFAYARTAEKIAAQHRKPLVHSMHTDTVSYTRIFTRALL
ncbi:MAG TPA: glycoside hydrolase, partial [Alphaproteobacteria bacterium]|nr:glycoside hydrolase [Alphaproteobacteria bacterium]